jgi:hypothetical protein
MDYPNPKSAFVPEGKQHPTIFQINPQNILQSIEKDLPLHLQKGKSAAAVIFLHYF